MGIDTDTGFLRVPFCEFSKKMSSPLRAIKLYEQKLTNSKLYWQVTVFCLLKGYKYIVNIDSLSRNIIPSKKIN